MSWKLSFAAFIFFTSASFGIVLFYVRKIDESNTLIQTARNLIEKSKSLPHYDLLTIKDAPKITVNHVNCHGLFGGNEQAIAVAEELQYNRSRLVLSDTDMKKTAENCEHFLTNQQFILQPVSEEELHFPLAFSLIVYKNAEQVERLLRAIYRPQNYYCIHIDLAANDTFFEAMAQITHCFENVFLSSKRTKVLWGEFGVLEAEMFCLKDLWKYRRWKYFINLTGQEFPLKTNLDIVKILKIFNGSNDAGATLHRIWRHNRHGKISEEEIPYGIRLGKGQVHVALSRSFVDFALHNQVGQQFYHWCNGTHIPDETFFNTLNISPLAGVPGAFTGEPGKDMEQFVQVVRRKKWDFLETCHGKSVRQICMMTIYDLPDLVKSRMLFVNKFEYEYHPIAYDCLEEYISNQVREEVEGTRHIDLEYYKILPFVLHHNPSKV